MHICLKGVKQIAPLQDFMDILGYKHLHFGSWQSRVVSNFFGSRFVGPHLVQIEPCLNHWKVLQIITIKCNQIPKTNICNISQVTIWKIENIIAKMSFDHVNDNLQDQHTNLTWDESIMKIVWSSFIHRFVNFTHIYFENTFNTNNCVDEWSMHLWMNKCHTNFESFYKSMCQMCFQYMI